MSLLLRSLNVCLLSNIFVAMNEAKAIDKRLPDALSILSIPTPTNGQTVPLAWFANGLIPAPGAPNPALDSNSMSVPDIAPFFSELPQVMPSVIQDSSISIALPSQGSQINLQSFIKANAAGDLMSSASDISTIESFSIAPLPPSDFINSVSMTLASASEAMPTPLPDANSGTQVTIMPPSADAFPLASSLTQAFDFSTLAPSTPSAAPTPTLDQASVSWNGVGNVHFASGFFSNSASVAITTGLSQSSYYTLDSMTPTSTSSGYEFTTVSQTRNTSLYPVPTIYDPRYPSGSILMTKPIKNRLTQIILVKIGQVLHFEWSTNYLLIPPLNLTLQLELATTQGQPILAGQEKNPLGTVSDANQKPVYIIGHDLNPNVTSYKWNSSGWLDLNPIPITGLYTPVFYDAVRGGRVGLRISGYLDPSIQNPLSIYFPQAYQDWSESMAAGVQSDTNAEYCPSCILWDDRAQQRSGSGFIPSSQDLSSGSHALLPSTLVTLLAVLFAYNLI